MTDTEKAAPRDQQYDGGPAFRGMLLRDYFAGQAINQVLAFADETNKRRGIASPIPFDIERIARSCYEVADAMIAEREKERS